MKSKGIKNFGYKNTISQNGDFSPHITNRKLVKELDAYCMMVGKNKTKYVEEAVRYKLNIDMEEMKKAINDFNDKVNNKKDKENTNNE